MVLMQKILQSFSFIAKVPFYLIIFLYRYFISPIIVPRCRFLPTCSEYAVEAIKVKGCIRGGFLAVKRICKCHPFGGSGYDPLAKE